MEWTFSDSVRLSLLSFSEASKACAALPGFSLFRRSLQPEREGEGQRRRLPPPDPLQAHREGSGRHQAGRCPHRAAACGPRLCG